MLNYTIYLIENFDSQLETTIDMDKKKMPIKLLFFYICSKNTLVFTLF